MKWLLIVVVLVSLVRYNVTLSRDRRQVGFDREPEIQPAGEEENFANQDNLERFLNKYDVDFRTLNNRQWMELFNYLTNLTEENGNKYVAAQNARLSGLQSQQREARQYLENVDNFDNSSAVAMLNRIVYAEFPSSSDQEVLGRTNTIITKLESIYGNAVVERGEEKLTLDPELTKLMATSRDYDELLWAWKGWHNATGPGMREDFITVVGLMNQAAQEQGYNDMGEAWQMVGFAERDIGPQIASVWPRVFELYQQIHAYVRRRLIEEFPNKGIKEDGPIPGHLLGNMWAQEWDYLIKLKRYQPYPDSPSYDVTSTMVEEGYTAVRIVEEADQFFTSIGFEEMTPAFWEKSMFTKPADRPVQCHPAAFDFFTDDDFRIKMCIEINSNDLNVVHHELGHIVYFMQYRKQPSVFRDGANAAFHEAIGDLIALSVETPVHLKKIGLLADDAQVPTGNDTIVDSDINFLMRSALRKVAFIPYGLLVDSWRWGVFSGEIDMNKMNEAWWQLKYDLQGVEPPVRRTEADFDPGAKYHVPANVPYIRYFFAHIAQFQFHKALCDKAGHVGFLHRCDIYESKEAGEVLMNALKLGASKPWPDVMEVLTGQREFSVEPILEYYRPLHDWLKTKNRNEVIGWNSYL